MAFPELVVGAPGLRVDSVVGEGGVVVLPASEGGLSLSERVISQSSGGVPGTPRAATRKIRVRWW